MSSVVLTGFMGTGKSTVGRLMAQRCGLDFVDLDEEIERRCGRSIREIFTDQGESAFRRIESDALEEALRDEPAILATGGGALLAPKNRALVGPSATVLCLTAEVRELRRRLNGSSDRPLLQASAGLETLLDERGAAYSIFPQIDTTNMSADAVADEIISRCGLAAAGILETERRMRSALFVQEGILSRLSLLLREAGMTGDIVVVTDETVAGAGHLESALAALSAHPGRTISLVVQPGEEHKNLETLKYLYDSCFEAKLDRSACVLALGGGVICDLSGMLAATFLRGLRFVSVPTTLLAQVDAAIGGKTGVDLASAKNLIGAFYLPEFVLVDPSTLRTLPPSALADGLAEILKIALIRSTDLFARLESLSHASDILKRVDIIRQAALEKVEVVQRDPYERGERMMLNFGHTIGHALETAGKFQLSHGQAISLGMVSETRLAVSRGTCDNHVLDTLLSLLTRFGLPVSISASALGSGTDEVMSFLWHDKKRQGQSLRFALPTALGAGEVQFINEAEARDAVRISLGDQ
jgi:shikimate kinase / 3-dehydroquinate synthase